MDPSGTPADRNLLIAGSEERAGDSGDRRVRYQPLVIVMLAVATGMALDRYGAQFLNGVAGFSLWWFACAGFLTIWWLAWRGRHENAAAWLLLVSAALTGSAWHHLNWYLYGNQEVGLFAKYNPAPACIEAVARQSPERVSAPPSTPLRAIPGSEQSRLIVDVIAIRDGTTLRSARGSCQLSTQGHLLGVHPGDKLRVFGQLARPAPPLNPGEFDFAAHARADGQLARVRSTAPECVSIVQKGRWSLTSAIDAVRVRAKELVRSLVGPQRAGLAAAILLGAREGLPYEATEPYLETGTIHVLAVQG